MLTRVSQVGSEEDKRGSKGANADLVRNLQDDDSDAERSADTRSWRNSLDYKRVLRLRCEHVYGAYRHDLFKRTTN